MDRNAQLVEVMKAEYVSLREETLETIRINYQILAICIPILYGLIYAQATFFESKDYLLTITSGYFTVFIATTIATLWQAEISARIRLAIYYRDILNPRLMKILINNNNRKLIEIKGIKTGSHLNKTVIGWEEFLRNQEMHLTYPEGIRKVFFGHYTQFRFGTLGLIGMASLVSSLISVVDAVIRYQAKDLGQLYFWIIISTYIICMVFLFKWPGSITAAWNAVKIEGTLPDRISE